MQAAGRSVRATTQNVSKSPRTKVITIHRCSYCGIYEGERPQAGCCSVCGTASDPIPVQVEVKRGR